MYYIHNGDTKIDLTLVEVFHKCVEKCIQINMGDAKCITFIMVMQKMIIVKVFHEGVEKCITFIRVIQNVLHSYGRSLMNSKK